MIPLPLKIGSVVFFVCSLGLAVPTYQKWMLACHASEYTAGEFVIESFQSICSAKRVTPLSYCRGTVNGSPETMNFINTAIEADAVRKTNRIGDKVMVWCHPKMPTEMPKNLSLRVLHPTFPLGDAWQDALLFSSFSLLPFLACLVGVGYFKWRKPRQA